MCVGALLACVSVRHTYIEFVEAREGVGSFESGVTKDGLLAGKQTQGLWKGS